MSWQRPPACLSHTSGDVSVTAGVVESAGDLEDISTDVSATVEDAIAPSVVELAPAPEAVVADVATAGVVAWSEHSPDIQLRPGVHFPSLDPQEPPRAMVSIYWQYQFTGVVAVSPVAR